MHEKNSFVSQAELGADKLKTIANRANRGGISFIGVIPILKDTREIVDNLLLTVDSPVGLYSSARWTTKEVFDKLRYWLQYRRDEQVSNPSVWGILDTLLSEVEKAGYEEGLLPWQRINEKKD